MLAESYLRSRTQVVLYLAAALIFAFLAVHSYRYGLYDLFQSGLLVVPALLAGAVYSWFRRGETTVYRGHFCLLTVVLILSLDDLSDGNLYSMHWLYGLGLFSFLLLPLRVAFNYNLFTLMSGSLIILFTFSFYQTLRFSCSYALLVGVAGMYAWLYHHKSRYLVEAGIRDVLTGAFNMRHWEMTLRQEVSRSDATGHPLSLLALELDYYEQILDVNGINTTNELLAEAGHLLLGLTRAGDSIYYADEGRFLFLLPSTHEEGLLVFAERLRRGVEQHAWPTGDAVTASIGCLTRLEGDADATQLRENLETALSRAQQSGHNKVVPWKS